MTVCDSCLTAAYDEGAKNWAIQVQVCTNLGADIADHLCDETEGYVKKCDCLCHPRRTMNQRDLDEILSQDIDGRLDIGDTNDGFSSQISK